MQRWIEVKKRQEGRVAPGRRERVPDHLARALERAGIAEIVDGPGEEDPKNPAPKVFGKEPARPTAAAPAATKKPTAWSGPAETPPAPGVELKKAELKEALKTNGVKIPRLATKAQLLNLYLKHIRD